MRHAIEAVDATIRYLPPYSPDLNPIEMVFAKLKARLKKAAPRTVDALWNEIGTLLDTFSPSLHPSAPITSNTQDMLPD